MPLSAESVRDRQPSKRPVATPLPVPRPQRVVHEGRFVRLEPLDADAHAVDLYALGHADETARASWDYLPYGPFPSAEAHAAWLRQQAAGDDPLFFAIRDLADGRTVGVATLMSIAPEHGSIEIGHLWFSPRLQRTPAATEALFLLLRHAFDDLGYRRMEWKCDAANAPSRAAATRLGYRFEGVFFNHRVVKGHNRDTAWFSILDEEWPRLRANFVAWLAPDNFDAQGGQLRSLRAMNQPGE
jgi:RimJ/RimL family protein N-acetyltransferase